MSSISERAKARAPQEEKREIALVVMCKTGPGKKDWSRCGVAFERRNGEVGYTVKMNTLPIDRNWLGEMVLLPPFAVEEENRAAV